MLVLRANIDRPFARGRPCIAHKKHQRHGDRRMNQRKPTVNPGPWRRMSTRLIATGATVLALTATTNAQTRIVSDVVAAGGTHSTGANMVLRGTIGQIVIGRTSGSGGSTWQGFWYRPANDVSAVPTTPVEAATDLYAGPNPCSDGVDIHFTSTLDDRASICLFDLLGNCVRRIPDEQRSAGAHHVRVNTADLPSGTYTAQLTIGNRRRSLTIMIAH